MSQETKYYITHKTLGATYEVIPEDFGNDDIDTEKVEDATVTFVTKEHDLAVTFDNSERAGIEKMFNAKWDISKEAPKKKKEDKKEESK